MMTTGSSRRVALIAGIISLAALIGYLYDVQDLYRIDAFSSVALHTAALFFLLSVLGVGAWLAHRAHFF